jgi:hypothetical protein
MRSTVVRRDEGIPGSDAEERVMEIGGPVAQRASRKPATRTTAAEPGVITLQPRSQQWVDDGDNVQMTTEDPPDADVDVDLGNWVPRRTTFTERRQRLAEQQRPRGTDDFAPKRRSTGQRQTDQLSRERGHVHWVVPVCAGMLLLVALYTACFWVYSLGLGIFNRISYGPMLTSEVSAVLGQSDSQANPSVIFASNVGGRIVVTILPGGDPTRAMVYEVPALEPSMWGDLNAVVATIDVQPHSATPNIYIHLVGNPDYWHFFARPSLVVTLQNTRHGFKVVLGSQ